MSSWVINSSDQGAFANEMVGAKVDHHRPVDLQEQVGKELHLGSVESPLSGRVFGEQIVDIDGEHVAEPDGPAALRGWSESR